MRKFISFVFIILIYFFLLSSKIDARSGCCSWHGGVSGCDTNTGRQVCNDGTYSPSCTCSYIPQIPIPTPIIIPSYIQGTPSYYYNNSTNSYDVTFNWDDWNQSSGWSIGISQYAGADPGLNMDTTESLWTFKNVHPGKKYINMKASVNSYWSRVSYWPIDVPALPTSTLTPTITPTLSLTNTPIPTQTTPPVKQQKNILDTTDESVQKPNFWSWLLSLVFRERK